MSIPSTKDELEALLHNPEKQAILQQVYTPQSIADLEAILQLDESTVERLIAEAYAIAQSHEERTFDVLLVLYRLYKQGGLK